MRIRHDGRLWDVMLLDDATLDTVVSIQPVAPKLRRRNREPEYWPVHDTRFDAEYASVFRRSDGSLTARGFRQLALEAIKEYSAFIDFFTY